MARELINANITHVSYVDKGANKKQFFLTKSAEQPTFQKEVKVFVNKEEAEQQLVYGIVYEPDVEDAHGDFMTAAEIEKAAHGFMKDARNIDTQHDFESGVGEVVESYIAPADFMLGEQEVKKGAWVLVTKATDEIWEQIKKGEITGYSMAGTAETIEKQEDEKPVSKSEDDEKGLFNLLKNFFAGKTTVEKGEVADKYKRDRRRREFWAAQDALNSVIFNWDDWDSHLETDTTKIREALQDFIDIAQEVLIEDDILKAVGKPPERDEADVKKEDIEKMLDEKLAPITKKLEEFEKEEGGAGAGEEPMPEEALLKQFAEVLDEKLTPVNERLEAVEKARGVSRQADPEGAGTHIEKSDGPSYMRHFG
ncbi:XkdF-like putative serine protease domain-containing protein [Sporosarcina sp. Marseille-Q4943]|uniref:XkdF-like putative serine protease domain-containing protein n=1 Tax=Sporosarcina sp. Marseille-Q4943 TaxID=2942204 RepID=UPI00208DC430|nr:XkdF-like putative serine protease domain-containing protein [Sporosarcina sp. Marseille-Q4943]